MLWGMRDLSSPTGDWCPLHWEHGVLTIGPPGKSLYNRLLKAVLYNLRAEIFKKVIFALWPAEWRAMKEIKFSCGLCLQLWVLLQSAKLLVHLIEELPFAKFSCIFLLVLNELRGSAVWNCQFQPFLKKINLFILFLAVLGLRFCARAFSSCSERGPLFIAVRGPLTVTASLVAEHRLQTRRLSSCGSRAQLLCGMWDLPRPGLEPVSPALAGRFSTTAPPWKPSAIFDLQKWSFYMI